MLSFGTLSASDWTGDTKLVYEVAYGISVAIYDETTAAFKTGCVVASQVTARRAISVTFTATVSHTHAAAASTAAQNHDATAMAANIARANTALGKSIPVPAASTMTVSAPSISSPSTGGDSSDGAPAWLLPVIIVAALVGLCACVGLIAYFSGAFRSSKPATAQADTKADATEETTKEEPEVAIEMTPSTTTAAVLTSANTDDGPTQEGNLPAVGVVAAPPAAERGCSDRVCVAP